MTSIQALIENLAKTPQILNHLLAQIPEERYAIRRLSDKWSIHEQVCHLVDAQSILLERFLQFEKEKTPYIQSHHPQEERNDKYYLSFNMKKELARFPTVREKMIALLRSFPDEYWNYKGQHEAFSPYSTRLLLGHTLNVDYAHLFSIEQLGLTKEGLEHEIMVLP
jgi:uncharacterized damage-inducible protein DinB